MDLIKLLSAKQVSTLRVEKTSKVGGKKVAITNTTKAIDVLDTSTREVEWRVKTRVGGIVSRIKDATITIKVIGHKKIKAANLMSGIRIVSNIKTMAEITKLCKRMATINMTGGRARSITSKGTLSSNINTMGLEPITTIKMTLSTNNSNMVDKINTTMGTKTVTTTTMLKLIHLSSI